MMDLDESLRALYFAPMPMIVLDNNRNVRLCNRPAEIVSSLLQTPVEPELTQLSLSLSGSS